MYVIITSFPGVDAGSTTLASGGGAKDATPPKAMWVDSGRVQW